MKLRGIAVLLIGLPVLAFTQSKSAEPSEPEMVLPQVILEIEDISVENVQAALPPEEELLPPERQIPLLAEGDLPVIEPAIPTSAAGDTTLAAGSAPAISTQAEIGAGLANTIVGKLSMKTLGKDPRLSLSFSHEGVDGFAEGFASYHPVGSGFDSRNDSLSGELAMKLGPVNGDIQGSFLEDDDGLQGQGPFADRLARGLGGSADFTAKPLDWLSIDGKASGGFDSLTLTGTTPYQMNEFRVSPGVGAEARFDPFTFGLTGEYAYRTATFGQGTTEEIHRVRAGLSAAWDLPASLLLKGSVGWFWSSASANLFTFPFPFELRFSGAPLDFLSFDIGGGYKVVTYDAKDILSASSWMLPQSLSDDGGWVADASVKLSFAKVLSLSGRLSFMDSAAMPDAAGSPQAAPDPATGLFLIAQRQAVQLGSELALRWDVVTGVTLRAGWKQEFLDSPAFLPRSEFSAQGIAIAQSGLFGADFTVSLLTGIAPDVQLPVVNLGGFVKLSDSVQLHLDLDDLLQPALGKPRYVLSPFVDPGFRVIATVQLSF